MGAKAQDILDKVFKAGTLGLMGYFVLLRSTSFCFWGGDWGLDILPSS